MPHHRQTYNYLNGHQNKQPRGKGRVFARQLPDQSIHLPPGAMFLSTAVEVVQHVNLVVVWGGLGFVVDTIGDYTFIAVYTTSLDPVTSSFIIFCYAVSLYALSTVAFVRSIEYVWAGFAAAHHLKQQYQHQQHP